MFYRRETRNCWEAGTSQENDEEESTHGCFNDQEFFLMLKTTTTMNILTLIFVLGFLPQVILGMVYHNCHVGSGDCENYFRLNRLFTPLRLVCLIVQDLVVMKRIMKKPE